ncbi:MAG: hypothetical protein EXS06_08275 [Planctomycetaceae bacterium]|nr:hypothetical protein [Planctomycetaceae bacterium]
MTLLIGTDEAGYGPNLGPLVVAASAWRGVEGGDDGADRLARAGAEIGAAARLGQPPWADSKQLYKPGGGLIAIERGVLAALAATAEGATAQRASHGIPSDGAALAAALGIDLPLITAPAEWTLFERTALPVAVPPRALALLAETVATTLPRLNVQLVAVACRVLHPGAFNALLDAGLNKSDILSRTTLSLAAELRATAPGEPAVVWCDRHGGRKTYAALVGRHFAAPLVRTIVETPTSSTYAIDAASLRIEFTVGGEARVPVALASMTAKYVRELAMAAFNVHWGTLAPGLRPTAGYPLDARRWRGDAAAALDRCGIPPDAFWRRA